MAYLLNSQPASPSAEGIFRMPLDSAPGFLDLFSPTVPDAFAHSTLQCILDKTTAPSPFSSPLTPLPSSAASSPLPSLTALICPLDSFAHSNLLLGSTQPQPNITFPHISPLNTNPPQIRNMATNPVPMLLHGSRDMSKFDGKSPVHLPQFFEDIEILGEAAGIDKATQIKATIRYADLNEVEVWQTLTAASGEDWDAFVVAVKDLTIVQSPCTVEMN
ncbi:hypothetical protein PAXINDRAFT_15544 [Paxillus involutus ATCC 200175]|uniref:Uncharacterized protein n=1 Tax=Paxillus involutus ATCC 200175 TaxID=664439 RepID=A0A0C9TUW7_PAXIN|nr:hypothetical protein PAXINDRAFT_15544 [Paxillus involutus ATCC 200175]